MVDAPPSEIRRAITKLYRYIYMIDQTDGQNPETEGQLVEPMPSSEEPTDIQTDQEEILDENVEQEPQLPDGASERTAQEFEKLKQANKELKKQLALKEPEQPRRSVLEDLTPQPQDSYLSQQQVENIAEGLVDDQGYVDVNLLNRSIQEANERARQAELKAQAAQENYEKFELSQIMEKVHQKYPAIDPYSPEFDQRAFKLVKNEMIGQMMKGMKDPMLAAKTVFEELYTPISKTKVQEEQRKQTVAKRDQANAITTTSPRTTQGVDHDRLVSGTRAGDRSALYERLKRSGF